MAFEKHLELDLEFGAETPYQAGPWKRRISAAALGISLFCTGLATGLVATQGAPEILRRDSLTKHVPQILQQENIAKHVPEFLKPESITKIFKNPFAKRAPLWQPAPGATWNYQLSAPPTAAQLADPTAFDVWNVDLFDTPAANISAIQNAGSSVICYLSAGSYENWRPDSTQFTAADKGKALGNWPGENWLKYRSTNVRNIMKARLDLAKSKGCNGVDPDNMDAYNNDNGWKATQQDTIDYVNFLASESAKRGLSIGLKNSLEVVGSVKDVVQYSVNESCTSFSECSALQPFITAGKPVFNVEYPKTSNNANSVPARTANKICQDPDATGFSRILKNTNLDTWIQPC